MQAYFCISFFFFLISSSFLFCLEAKLFLVFISAGSKIAWNSSVLSTKRFIKMKNYRNHLKKKTRQNRMLYAVFNFRFCPLSIFLKTAILFYDAVVLNFELRFNVMLNLYISDVQMLSNSTSFTLIKHLKHFSFWVSHGVYFITFSRCFFSLHLPQTATVASPFPCKNNSCLQQIIDDWLIDQTHCLLCVQTSVLITPISE